MRLSTILPGSRAQGLKEYLLRGMHAQSCCRGAVAATATHSWAGLLQGAGGKGSCSAGFEAQLMLRIGQAAQWGVSTGANRLEGEFQNGTHQY